MQTIRDTEIRHQHAAMSQDAAQRVEQRTHCRCTGNTASSAPRWRASPPRPDVAGGRRDRRPGVHRVPGRALVEDPIQQPAGTPEQGDPPPDRRRRDLPGQTFGDPAGWRGAGRAERRRGLRYMSAESLAKARMRVIDGGDPLAIDEPATTTPRVG
jgi:hypothetical protein